MTKHNLIRPSLLVLAGAVLSLTLAGCDQKKDQSAQAPPPPALPLTAGPATPETPAPPAAALPAAPRVRVVHVRDPADRYAYVDRAYEMSNAIGQAPPDYGFDYDGVHPWVWRSSNREVRLVEPVEGGYRYYFYRPGSDEPYLVRDRDYSYGFSDGQLVTIYDNDGRSLPPDYVDRRADDAGRYLARGVALYQASLRSERRSVNAANWAARRAELDAERGRWEEQQNQQDDWRSYHARHEAEDQSYWRIERDQRDRSARSFDDWQSRGYSGPPPPPVAYGGQDGFQGDSRGNGWGDRGRYAPPNGDAAQQPQQQTQQQPPTDAQRTDAARAKAQADAAQQAQAKAAADAQQADAARAKAQADAAAQAKAVADAQRIQADAARAKAQADAAAQAKAAADAQRVQADAARAKAQADAARAKAQADAAAQAKAVADAQRADAVRAKAQADAAAQAKAQADAARAKAQADAAAQAKAVADAQRAQAEAAHAKAQADAARAKAQADAAAQIKAVADAQAQSKADAARQAQIRAAHGAPAALQTPPAAGQPTPEQIAARRAKKAHDDAHPHDDTTGKPPDQQ